MFKLFALPGFLMLIGTVLAVNVQLDEPDSGNDTALKKVSESDAALKDVVGDDALRKQDSSERDQPSILLIPDTVADTRTPEAADDEDQDAKHGKADKKAPSDLPLVDDTFEPASGTETNDATTEKPADEQTAEILNRLLELRARLQQDLSDEQLVQVRDELLRLRNLLSGENAFAGPSPNCPAVAACESKDAVIYLRLPALQNTNQSYTANGVFAFNSLISGAVARGFENATIRAMNATKACPDCEQEADK